MCFKHSIENFPLLKKLCKKFRSCDAKWKKILPVKQVTIFLSLRNLKQALKEISCNIAPRHLFECSNFVR